ncbi:hypothetical protein TNCV_1923781 [Trichonephila clavipes]|nr:hypothetical protein TNCV_1923781 [Trichonephila clavipes]
MLPRLWSVRLFRTARVTNEARKIRCVYFRSKRRYFIDHAKTIVFAGCLVLVYIDITPPHSFSFSLILDLDYLTTRQWRNGEYLGPPAKSGFRPLA